MTREMAANEANSGLIMAGGERHSFDVAHELRLSMELLEQEDEAARLEQARTSAELALQQQAGLREIRVLEVEAADLQAELDASKRAQRELAAELATLRQSAEEAQESALRRGLEDQLEATSLALKAREGEWRRELDTAHARASEAERELAQLKRAVDGHTEALRQAQHEAAARLESERAADQRSLRHAQAQLACAAADSDEKLSAARDEWSARGRRLERELASATAALEALRAESAAELAALHGRLHAVREATALAEARASAADEQSASLRAQLAQAREVADDAQLEWSRALEDARALEEARDAARADAEAARAKAHAARAREGQLRDSLRRSEEGRSGLAERAADELLAQAEAHRLALARLGIRTADLREENRRRAREAKELRREMEGMRASEGRLRELMTAAVAPAGLDWQGDWPTARPVHAPSSAAREALYARARAEMLSGLASAGSVAPSEVAAGGGRAPL